MNVGFVGLGNLGLAIAENLVSSLPRLLVYNRTTSKAQPLVEKGATLCGSVAELAGRCDIVFTIVSEDEALKQITTGDGGLAAHLPPGGVHVSMSTILPQTSIELEQLHTRHGSRYVACPVMARPEVARARKINFLISGDPASIERVKPLLNQAGGTGIWEFGPNVGAANVAKLCSNYLVLMAMESLAESLDLARRSQLDVELWMRMLTQTYFNSPVYINYSKMMIEEKFEPASFNMELGLKDMTLVLKQAASVNSTMPAGEQTRSILEQSIAAGFGKLDVTAVARAIQQGVGSNQ